MGRKKSFGRKVGRFTWLGITGLFKGAWWIIKNTGILIGRAVSKGGQKASQSYKEKKEKRMKIKKSKEFPAVYSNLNVKEEIEGKYDYFEKKLLKDSLIMAIVGKRGSGKSTLGFRLMENIHAKKKRPCFVLGVKQKHIPGWIDSIETLDEAKNGGVVLVDEGAVEFSSRSSMSKRNKELAELLAIARHKDLSLVLVTQNTGMLDKNVMNLCDSIILKEGSLLQAEMERPVIKKLYDKVGNRWKGMDLIDKKKHIYVFDSDFEGFIEAELPSFWNDKISKSRA